MTNPRPSRRQLAFHSWERGLFLHFGLRTFYEGWRDFDERPMDAAQFDPSELDCEQWAAVAHEAGFRYVILTAKHHDGFCIWPSRLTDFSVASSPWRGGRGDIVREFADACHRRGLAVGLYYSPYDASHPSYEDERAYDDYFISQVSELLLPYGQIDILWFDGCGSEGHSYDWPRIIREIRRMQPEVLIFNMGDPDIRWIGNEDGYAPLGTRNVATRAPLDGGAPAEVWLVPECDSRMRDNNWFYSEADAYTVKSVDELLGMYYYSVGRGANLLINVGPDRRGLLPEPDARHLIELGREIERRFSRPFATLADCVGSDDTWSYETSPYVLVNHVVLGEDTAQGEHVTGFCVKALPAHGRETITLYEGRAIGHKAICRFPTFRARRISVEVTEADGPVQLIKLDLFHVGD